MAEARIFDPLRAEHFPLTAKGRTIVNAFGITIGTMFDTTTARAVVEVANAGIPAARTAVEWQRAITQQAAKEAV